MRIVSGNPAGDLTDLIKRAKSLCIVRAAWLLTNIIKDERIFLNTIDKTILYDI